MSDRGELYQRGAAAAHRVLGAYGIDLQKALDPLDRDDFLRIVARFARALDGASATHEADAIREALATLDVDWATMSETARESVLLAARNAIDGAAARVMPAIAERFELEAPAIMAGARESAVSRFGLNIITSLSQRDLFAERAVRASYSNFVTDAFGRRRDDISAIARDIVAQGMAEGAGRDEIASRLAAALGDRITRGSAYWAIVATSFANTARTASQLNAFGEAGIERYEFVAVLDEVTSDQCRFYDGKIFSTAAGIAVMNNQLAARSAEQLREANPWVRVGGDEDGQYLYVERGGERVQLARIDRSGVGARDDVGEYSRAVSTQKLESEAVPYPPLHAHCRSEIVPAP